MPGEQEAGVRPIYKEGDRVLVEMPFGYCDVLIEGVEAEGGRLRVYGVCVGLALRFTAEAAGWRASRAYAGTTCVTPSVPGWPRPDVVRRRLLI